jgi:hypothetical protein
MGDQITDEPYVLTSQVDVDCVAVNLFYFLNQLYVVILLGLGF